MPDGKAKASAYRRAGIDFLGSRLEGMFRALTTPEDIALHNVIQQEVMLIVGKDEVIKFYQTLANILLQERAKKKREKRTIKRFAKMVAESILSVAKG